jgi:thymidylate kinase
MTVALIGPDGAGKTTVARRLEAELPLPVSYLYMGVNAEASNRALPTTRLARAVKRRRGHGPDDAGPPPPPSERPTGAPSLRKRLRATARLANRLADEWYRQLLAWRATRRGEVVVFDRHFFADYHAYDVEGGDRLPLSRRIHGFVLARAYPKPDLVVYLDAPAEVLLARKGEGDVAALERRRGDYLRLADVAPDFVIVDATRPADEVARAVAGEVLARTDDGDGGHR